MKNVEAFKKYYANATKEQVIEDMYLDNCNLQQELQKKDNIINAVKEELKQKQEYYRYRKDNRYRTFLSNILDKIEELENGNNNKNIR